MASIQNVGSKRGQYLSGFGLLGVRGADSLGIQVSSKQGDAGSDLGLHGQGGPKEDDTGHDNCYALDDVADAVADGAHAAKGVKGKLVVQMVEETDGEELGVERGCANLWRRPKDKVRLAF